MKEFQYISLKNDGSKVKDVIFANDKDEAINLLNQKGLQILQINQIYHKKLFKLNLVKKTSFEERLSFLKQFALLAKAGMSINAILEILERSTGNVILKEQIRKLSKQTKEGFNISTALRNSVIGLPEYVYSLIMVGEKSGNLNQTLTDCAKQLEDESKIKKNVINAIIYPSFLFAVFVFSLIFMLFTIIPQFSQMIEDKELIPSYARIVFSISDFAVANKTVFFGSLISFVVLIYFFISKQKKLFTNFLWHLPLLDKIMIELNKEKWARIHYYSLINGLTLLEATELSTTSMTSNPFKDELKGTISELKSGEQLDLIYAKNKYLNDIDKGMISAGSSSGKLPEIFQFLADEYYENLQNLFKRLLSLLEPLLIILITTMVGFLAIVIFTSLPSLYETI